MDEWGEHLPKIIYLQTRFRSYLARKQLRILREEHRARVGGYSRSAVPDG